MYMLFCWHAFTAQDVIMAKPKSPPICTVWQVKNMSHYLNIFLSAFQLTVKNEITNPIIFLMLRNISSCFKVIFFFKKMNEISFYLGYFFFKIYFVWKFKKSNKIFFYFLKSFGCLPVTWTENFSLQLTFVTLVYSLHGLC